MDRQHNPAIIGRISTGLVSRVQTPVSRIWHQLGGYHLLGCGKAPAHTIKPRGRVRRDGLLRFRLAGRRPLGQFGFAVRRSRRVVSTVGGGPCRAFAVGVPFVAGRYRDPERSDRQANPINWRVLSNNVNGVTGMQHLRLGPATLSAQRYIQGSIRRGARRFSVFRDPQRRATPGSCRPTHLPRMPGIDYGRRPGARWQLSRARSPDLSESGGDSREASRRGGIGGAAGSAAGTTRRLSGSLGRI